MPAQEELRDPDKAMESLLEWVLFDYEGELVLTIINKDRGTDNYAASSTIKNENCIFRIAVYVEKKSDKEIYLVTSIMIAAFQSAFMRRNVYLHRMEIDFYETQQREPLVDMIIDNIFK